MKKRKKLFFGLFGHAINSDKESVKEQELQSEIRNICIWSKTGANVSVLNLETMENKTFGLPEDKRNIIGLLEQGRIKVISYSEKNYKQN